MGASLGAASRYGVSRLFQGTSAFWSTFFVNMVGALCMGFLWLFLQKKFVEAPYLSLFLIVGFLGSFTTFSALSRDLYLLMERSFWQFLFLAVGQISLGVVLFWLGAKIAKTLVP